MSSDEDRAKEILKGFKLYPLNLWYKQRINPKRPSSVLFKGTT